MERGLIIGKYTLESLTNGMYSSPLDMYREYIQNAVDSIDIAIEQGLISSESDIKSSQMGENMGKNTQKPPQMGENVGKNTQKCPFPTLTVKNVFELIRQNPTIKYVQIEENLGIDDNTVQRSIAWLKDNGYINKEHSKVKGVWQLI